MAKKKKKRYKSLKKFQPPRENLPTAPASEPLSPEASGKSSGQRIALVISLALVVATLLVYWPVAGYDFVLLDDPNYVTENHAVLEGVTMKGLNWAFFSTTPPYWHPLTFISHMVDVELFDLQAGRHHQTNLLFHILNVLLLFRVLSAMTGARWRSAIVAALFAIHPLRIESVAWVAERKDVLSAFFALLTIWAYHWYVRRGLWWRYVVVMVLLSLGLMSKPMLVTLPLVLLLLDFWPLQRWKWGDKWKDFTPLVMEKAPLLVLSTLSSVITFNVQRKIGAVASFEGLSVPARLSNGLVSYVKYLVKMVWPVDLAVIYPISLDGYPWWLAAGAAAVLLSVTWLAVTQMRRRPYLATGWFWYLGTLFPVSGVSQTGSQAMADRFTYIPLIGIFIVLAWAVEDRFLQSKQLRIAAGSVVLVVISSFILVSRSQIVFWRDSPTLLNHAIDVTESNPILHYNMGIYFGKRGEFERSIEHYQKAIEEYPKYSEAHNNLGMILGQKGQVDEAIPHWKEAIRIQPLNLDARYNLGMAMMGLWQYPEAIAQFEEILKYTPSNGQVRTMLEYARAKSGSPQPR